ncbi:MAG: TadE/TadG family type IV pilus assembly protein [Gemmobacter sp.]
MLPTMYWRSFRFRTMLRREDGGATVEAVLWMPLLMFVLALVADAAMIYSSQSQALRIVQDANRSMSIGRFRTTTEAQGFIRDRLATISPNAEIVTRVIDGVIITSVTMPASDLSVTRLVPAFADISISVTAQHVAEV